MNTPTLRTDRLILRKFIKGDNCPIGYVNVDTHDVNNIRSDEVMRKLGMKYQYSYEEQWQLPAGIREEIFDKNNMVCYTEHSSYWGDCMNTVVTSKEDILKASRKLIQQQGWPAINIRSVATGCGVSVGSIYNYFDSKSALVCATVESVWCEIFHRPKDSAVFQDTMACITWIYGRMEYGCRQYPGFFTLHSLGFMQEDKSDGKRRMQQTWQHILDGLCFVLKQDARIRADAFTGQFTVERFADVLFSLMLSALLRQDYDPAAILEIVRRTLY